MMGAKHGNTSKVPVNKTPAELEMDVLALLKGKYYDFNLTHFRSMIKAHEGIDIGRSVIYRLAKKYNLVKRPKRTPRTKVHKPRARMPQEGMLIQFDDLLMFGLIILYVILLVVSTMPLERLLELNFS
ncbi:MAG: hypothetical protein HQK52_23425 [Oligoflexia bacterium]|nr:hypothetical protein [Oligoflexia bacterium]